MSISANYGPAADRTQGLKVIRAAHEKGVTYAALKSVMAQNARGGRAAIAR
jgi:hypothetical protein